MALDLKVGCCGFPKARSKHYECFKVVEVQQTFYQPPTLMTVARWRAEAPADFEFTVKAWQLITHESKSPTYGEVSHFRIHGITGYRYRFSPEDLEALEEKCQGKCYCLFNNVSMWTDALAFQGLMNARGRSQEKSRRGISKNP